MGQSPRQRPAKLAGKLKSIRARLNLTQSQMADALQESKAGLQSGHVSEYESGKREPSLIIVLRYSRIAKVAVEVLIDDELELPKRLQR